MFKYVRVIFTIDFKQKYEMRALIKKMVHFCENKTRQRKKKTIRFMKHLFYYDMFRFCYPCIVLVGFCESSLQPNKMVQQHYSSKTGK